MKKFLCSLTAALFITTSAFAIDPQAKRIQTDTSNFDKNLSASDTDVQKALETLDELTSGASDHSTLSNLDYASSGHTGFEASLGNPDADGYLLSSTDEGVRSWISAPDSMVYPGAGIAVSTGSAWDTSITDNSSNWNTAYGWGDHALAGYLTAETDPIFNAWLLATPPLYSETDPIFSAWLIATPPLYSESDPLSLHLDQSSPQTFSGGAVTGTGLLSVTAGTLGLDTNTYLTAEADTWATVMARGNQSDTAGIIDVTDTEAFLIRKDSDGGDIFTVDTTNSRVTTTGAGVFTVGIEDGSGGANALCIDSTNRYLFDGSNIAVNWASRSLIDTSGMVTYLTWGSALTAPNGLTSNDRVVIDKAVSGGADPSVNSSLQIYDGTPTLFNHVFGVFPMYSNAKTMVVLGNATREGGFDLYNYRSLEGDSTYDFIFNTKGSGSSAVERLRITGNAAAASATFANTYVTAPKFLNTGFVTLTDASATPSVGGSNVFLASNTGATTITNFSDGTTGQIIKVVATNGNTTIQNNGTTINLNGTGDYTLGAGDTASLIYDGTKWNEIGRGGATSGSITGSGAANQVAYWSGTSALTGSSNLTFNGSLLTSEVPQIIDVTGTEALLVRKNADGGDVFTVDTTNSRVGIGITPAYPFHLYHSTSGTNIPIARFEGAAGNVKVVSDATRNRMTLSVENANAPDAGRPVFNTIVTGDTYARFGFDGYGKLNWGADGTADFDTTLYRSGVGILGTESSFKIISDSKKIYFGAGDDASIYYDGTNLIINPKEVGSGLVDVDGDLSADIIKTNKISRNDPAQSDFYYIDYQETGTPYFNIGTSGGFPLNLYTNNNSATPAIQISDTQLYVYVNTNLHVLSGGLNVVPDGTNPVLSTASYGLYSSATYMVVDWDNGYLKDETANNYMSVDWFSRRLLDSSENVLVDYESGYLNDTTPQISVDWINRLLVASDGTTTILDYSTDGTADFQDNDIVTVGAVKGVHKAADGTSAVADGTYTVGIGGTTNGTITIKDGIITAVQEAVA